MKPAVAYLRVSTRKQGESGLGIDAQRADLEWFCQHNGYKLIDDPFLEIESGRKSSRPVLQDAIARAEGTRATLLIAKLDRLTRSNRFMNELLDRPELKFKACDVPEADRMTLQILSSVAEREARQISKNTKVALAAAKARGVVLGNPANLTATACYNGARIANEVKRRKRDRTIERVAKRMRELRNEGAGYGQIAAVLNHEGWLTSQDNKWGAKTVWRAMRRLAAMKSTQFP